MSLVDHPSCHMSFVDHPLSHMSFADHPSFHTCMSFVEHPLFHMFLVDIYELTCLCTDQVVPHVGSYHCLTIMYARARRFYICLLSFCSWFSSVCFICDICMYIMYTKTYIVQSHFIDFELFRIRADFHETAPLQLQISFETMTLLGYALKSGSIRKWPCRHNSTKIAMFHCVRHNSSSKRP